jgi:hypothetical protein
VLLSSGFIIKNFLKKIYNTPSIRKSLAALLLCPRNPDMNTTSLEYKSSGLKRLSSFKQAFFSDNDIVDNGTLHDFVNLFCEYQLADNNYMNIHHEASLHTNDDGWFDGLTVDEVLRLITYIIWTDKFVDGFLTTKVKDKTLYHLLVRLENIQRDPAMPASRN